jgi:hypothetical protein
MVIRRSALDAIGGSDETLPTNEDTDLFVRLAPLGRFAFIPERLTVRSLGPDRYSLKAPAGDVGWRRVLDRVLASPEGALVRPRLRQLRASRHARLFDRLASQDQWSPALRELAAGLALDPLVLVRLAHVRRKLWPLAKRAARRLVPRR